MTNDMPHRTPSDDQPRPEVAIRKPITKAINLALRQDDAYEAFLAQVDDQVKDLIITEMDGVCDTPPRT